MTPDDIRSQHFTTRLLQGLSPEEVSAFLEDVAEAYGSVQEINSSLAARVKALEDEIQALAARRTPPAPPAKEVPAPGHVEALRATVLREVEALLHDAHAQEQALLEGAREREAEILRDAEAAKARLQSEADELVVAATARAERLFLEAREQEAELRNEIDRLTQSRLQLIDDVQATLDAYQQWLATVDPRGRARARREALDVTDGHGNGVGAAEESRAG